MDDTKTLDRKGRRAIAIGAIVAVGFIVFTCVFSFLPQFTGQRGEDVIEAGLSWAIVLGSMIATAIGVGMIAYGFVQLGRARRQDHSHA